MYGLDDSNKNRRQIEKIASNAPYTMSQADIRTHINLESRIDSLIRKIDEILVE